MRRQAAAWWIFASLCASVATAATYEVAPDGSGDFATIQDAIDASTDGDVIELLPGTYRGTGNRYIDYLGKSVVVQSKFDDPGSCIIDCEDADVGFVMWNEEDRSAVLRGVTVTRGRTAVAGGIILLDASPTIVNCRFVDNVATNGLGGGAVRSSRSSPLFQDCYFGNNTGGLGAGAIWSSYDQNMEIVDCTFANNFADAGGPFTVAGAVSFENGTGSITNCLFYGNEAAVGVGAVAALIDASCVMTGCTIVGNIGSWALYVGLRSEMDIQNTIVAFNSGNALDCWNGGATLACCNLFGNDQDWGDCVAEQAGVNGNINLDPLFCDMDSDWSLRSDSPCASQNSQGCGQIGSLGVGCGATPVFERSWGQIKASFGSRP